MDNELERIWKCVFICNLRYHPGICLEGLKKVIEYLSQDKVRTQDFINI
jgi:hypothetical protein